MAKDTKPTIKQMMSPENRLSVCRDYTRLWQQYFQFFAEGFEEKKIYEKDEQAFFQLMQVLSLNHYRFAAMAGDFFKDSEGILKVMTDTVSLQAMKQMSDAQLSKLQIDWHTLFLAMNKALGKLIQIQPPPPGEGKVKKKKK
jgi:hypothetical protein